MSEDIKEVEETTEEEILETNDDTEQDEDLSGLESEEDESEDEESNDEGDEEEIDYQTQLEEAQGKLAKQNERIAKQDKKIMKIKKKNKTDEFGDEVEEEEEDIDAKLDAKLQSNMVSLREDIIDDAIEAVASNDNEAKLIRFYFDNTLNVKGFSKKEIIESVGFAKAIANKGKTEIKDKIISKKIKSANSKGSPAFAGNPQNKKTLKVTAYDRKQADKYFKGDVKKWMKFKD